MNKTFPLLSIFFIAFFITLTQTSLPQFAIPKNVIAGGAVESSNSSNNMIGTIGQPLIGKMKNSLFNVFIGFWYKMENIAVGIERMIENIPEVVRLEQNFPNPFSDHTSIIIIPSDTRYDISTEKWLTSFKIYDMLGREVLDLTSNVRNNFELTIYNSQLPLPGLYYYRLVASNFSITKTMLFLR